MKITYLEVTFRNGRPLAAYLHLAGRGRTRSARSRRVPPGLIIDFARDGKALGIEITSPGRVSVATLNRALRSLGAEPITREDLAPLSAA